MRATSPCAGAAARFVADEEAHEAARELTGDLP